MGRQAVDIGVVRIVAGPHAGRLGYYDDDTEDDDGKRVCVVYLGVPLRRAPVLIPKRSLRVATDEQKAEYERKFLSRISHPVRDAMGLDP